MAFLIFASGSGGTGSIWWAGLCMLGDLLQELGPGFAEASNLQGMPIP